MADEDTKIKDNEFKDNKPGVKVEPSKEPEPVKDEPKANTFADIVKDVESKATIRESVEALIQHVALEADAKASEGAKAVSDFATTLHDKALAFAEAVEKNLKLPEGHKMGGAHDDAAGDEPKKMPEGAVPVDDLSPLDNTEAYEAALAAGFEPHEARSMTAPGSNI